MVCADWLEDLGQRERGEFIRVQVELARMPTDALRQRELALWTAVQGSYLADFPADPHGSVSLDLPNRIITIPEPGASDAGVSSASPSRPSCWASNAASAGGRAPVRRVTA